MPRRQVRESTEFTAQLRTLGDIQFLDMRLSIVHWVATYDAEDLPAVSPSGLVRVAKVDALGSIPALRVFVGLDGDTANLLWVEKIEPEDEIQ